MIEGPVSSKINSQRCSQSKVGENWCFKYNTSIIVMEEHVESHNSSDAYDLIRWTTCNTTCLSFLTGNVLSVEDEAELESIPNKLAKSRKLYKLLSTKTGWYPHLISALKESNQTGALKIVQRLGEEKEVSKCFDASHSTATELCGKRHKNPIHFDVIAPVLNFTGRELQLSELHRLLQNNLEKRAVISQLASVVGLGGIGKTELARKYIQKYGEEFYDGNVVWISAETEKTLSESFRTLASIHLSRPLTSVDDKDLEIIRMVDKIYSFFNKQKVLFIFDNAESTDHLQKFMPFGLPSSSSLPYILITSRDREWSFSAPVLELDEMIEEDAITFVKRSLRLENDDNNVEIIRLVNRLQRYPLALSQATSYIKRRRFLGNFSISEYLDEFEKNSEKLLDSKVPPAEFNTYRKTTLTTWRVTTEHIASDEENGRCAMEILNSIAYFRPDKIPMSILARLSGGVNYQKALRLLVKYSMLNVQREDKTLSVHRLVQDVTRIQLRKTNQEEQALKIALQLVTCSTSGVFDEELVDHVLSILKYSYSYDCNPMLSAEFKYIPWRIFKILNENRRYEKGNPLEKGLAVVLEEYLSKIVGQEFDLAFGTYNRVETFESLRENIVNLYIIYVLIKENDFSQNSLLCIETLFAVRYVQQGSFQEALKLLPEIFGQHKTLYGLNNLRTIDILVNLAKCVWKLGTSNTSTGLSDKDRTKLRFAISVMKEAHQTNLEMVGKHIYWTTTIFEIAHFLHGVGDTDYAINILNVVIERTTEGGEKRFQIFEIYSMILLADIKKDKEEYDQHLVACHNLLSKLITLRGKTDELTLKVQGMVATAFLKLGDFEAAAQTYTDILKSLETKRQLPHPDRPLKIQVEIVNILCKLERSEMNLQRLGIMKTKMETEFGESHPLLGTLKSQIELLSRDNFEVNP